MELKEYERYRTELGVLYKGDCLEILPLLEKEVKVNCVVTDPPYGIDFQSGKRKEKHLKIANDSSLDWIEEWYRKLDNIIETNSHIYIFSGYQKIDEFKKSFDEYFKLKNILIWEKNNAGMGDLVSQYAPKYEMCLFGIKGQRNLKNGRDPDILKTKKTSNNLHPTQKPVDLYKYMIEKSTETNDIVIDCFSGSGTLAVACEELGRRWICIEKEDKYCDVTVDRLQNIQQQLF